MCVCVCVYVHIYVHIYTYTYLYLYIYIYRYRYMTSIRKSLVINIPLKIFSFGALSFSIILTIGIYFTFALTCINECLDLYEAYK